jgi:hypothetical protein
VGGVDEAMSMSALRDGVERIDLEDTLGDDLEPYVDQIRAALDLDRVEDAKAAIVAVLRVMRLGEGSEGGFPVGAEADLVDLVGFRDDG